MSFIKSANEVTNKVNFCNKVAKDTSSKYNQLELELDNKKFNQNLANMRLVDIPTTGLGEFNEVNEKTSTADYEAHLQTRKTKIQYIIAILVEIKLVHNKEQAILEMHYDFNHDDIMKKIDSLFTI